MFDRDSVLKFGSSVRVEAVEVIGIVPTFDLPAVVAPSRLGDYGADTRVVGLESPLVFDAEIAHVGGSRFDRTTMTED